MTSNLYSITSTLSGTFIEIQDVSCCRSLQNKPSLPLPPSIHPSCPARGKERTLTHSEEDEDPGPKRPEPSHHLRAKKGHSGARSVRRLFSPSVGLRYERRETLMYVQRESRCFSSRCGLAPPTAAASVSTEELLIHEEELKHLRLYRVQILE